MTPRRDQSTGTADAGAGKPHAPGEQGSGKMSLGDELRSFSKTLGILSGIVGVLSLGYVALFVATLVLSPRDAREMFGGMLMPRPRASCQRNLKQMGIVFKMYAHENEGKMWPRLSGTPGQLMMGAQDVYPDYLTEGTILLCVDDDTLDSLREEEDPTLLIDDHSFFYLGYMLTNEQEGLAFLDMYRTDFQAMSGFVGDIPAPEGLGSRGGSAFLRLRETLEVDQSLVPVMVEDPDHHDNPGGNVLYMDGHVEFVEFPGKFPMTPAFIEALRDAAGKPE